MMNVDQNTKFQSTQVMSANLANWTLNLKKIQHHINVRCRDLGWPSVSSQGTDRGPITEKDIERSDSQILVGHHFHDSIRGLERFQEINSICQRENRTIIYLTDNAIAEQFLNFSNIKFKIIPQGMTIGADPNAFIQKPMAQLKKFNCFMQRSDMVRQTWFYFLHERNLLDQGYVSYLMYKPAGIDGEVDPSNFQAVFDHTHEKHQLGDLPHFQRAHKLLRDQIPYRNFAERATCLEQCILTSKYSLVLESKCVEDDYGAISISEKTIRSLMLPCIPLLFSRAGSVRFLKSHGLRLPSCLDEIDMLPWQDRQMRLLEIIEQDEITDYSDQMYDDYLHNFELLKKWEKDWQSSMFWDDIFDSITKELRA